MRMDRFLRPSRHVLVAAACFAIIAPLDAQGPSRPAICVLPFDGNAGSAADREVMADDLATRLVDTGHFRVMPAAWLPHTGAALSPADLRDFASAAGVQYLITGALHESATTSRSVPRAAPFVVAAQGHLAPYQGLLVLPMIRTRAMATQTLSLDVRILDVATSDVVGTLNAASPWASRSSVARDKARQRALEQVAGRLDAGRARIFPH